MLTLSPSIRLYLSLAPADMRRSVDGLSALVRSACGEEPLSGHLFLFRNRRGDRLKGMIDITKKAAMPATQANLSHRTVLSVGMGSIPRKIKKEGPLPWGSAPRKNVTPSTTGK